MIAVPVYNTIVLPGSSFTFQGSFFKELSGVDEAAAGDKVMFLFLKEEKPRADVRPEDIRPIGVSAHVESISDDGNVTVKCEERVTLESIEIDEEGNISVSAAARADILLQQRPRRIKMPPLARVAPADHKRLGALIDLHDPVQVPELRRPHLRRPGSVPLLFLHHSSLPRAAKPRGFLRSYHISAQNTTTASAPLHRRPSLSNSARISPASYRPPLFTTPRFSHTSLPLAPRLSSLAAPDVFSIHGKCVSSLHYKCILPFAANLCCIF